MYVHEGGSWALYDSMYTVHSLLCLGFLDTPRSFLTTLPSVLEAAEDYDDDDDAEAALDMSSVALRLW